MFGAYHFARPAGTSLARTTASAIKQANHFLAVAGPQPGELPPVLDLEKTGSLSKQRLLAWTLAWIGQIDARTGVEPFVYTSPLFWKGNLGDSTAAAAAGTGLWIAHWTSNSKPLVPAQNWGGNGSAVLAVDELRHGAGGQALARDGDRLNGTKLGSVDIQPFPSGLPVLSTPPAIVGPPEAGLLLAAVPGQWEKGGKPLTFTYQWRRCDAAGANCVAITGATGESYRPVGDDVGYSSRSS